MIQGRLDHHIFESKALQGNRLGDPHVRSLWVYLPPGYDELQERYFPVVLMLSSHGNTGASMLNWRAWDESLDQQVDRLIVSGECPPHIMIIPDTWTRLGGALHLNSPALGNYADYLLDEILPYVESKYRVTGRRAIMGRSSGGYAALYHAMTRPELFQAAADHSGDAYFEYMALPEIARLHRNLARYGGLDGLMEDTKLNTPKDQAFYDTISILTFAATFAPNPKAKHGFDLPIEPETGALDHEVWERCLEMDPVRLVTNRRLADALGTLRELFIDCGQFDEYNLQVGARLVSRGLSQMGVAHTYEEYPGGHRHTHFRYNVSLPRLVKALAD